MTGAAFVAAAVGLSLAAASDRTPVSWVAPYGLLVAVLWWVAVVLGVAAACSRADRLAAGSVTGALAVAGYVLSIALARPAGGRLAVLASATDWALAVATLAVPWGIGMGFGSSVLRHRRALEGPGA